MYHNVLRQCLVRLLRFSLLVFYALPCSPSMPYFVCLLCPNLFAFYALQTLYSMFYLVLLGYV